MISTCVSGLHLEEGGVGEKVRAKASNRVDTQ